MVKFKRIPTQFIAALGYPGGDLRERRADVGCNKQDDAVPLVIGVAVE